MKLRYERNRTDKDRLAGRNPRGNAHTLAGPKLNSPQIKFVGIMQRCYAFLSFWRYMGTLIVLSLVWGDTHVCVLWFRACGAKMSVHLLCLQQFGAKSFYVYCAFISSG